MPLSLRRLLWSYSELLLEPFPVLNPELLPLQLRQLNRVLALRRPLILRLSCPKDAPRTCAAMITRVSLGITRIAARDLQKEARERLPFEQARCAVQAIQMKERR
jgi:hypothetical protein